MYKPSNECQGEVNLANCAHYEIRYPSKVLLSNLITRYFDEFSAKEKHVKILTIGKMLLTHSRPSVWLELKTPTP